MATHVGADANFRACGRHQVKVRIKAGHAVNLIKRRLRARGQGLQFRPGQKAVAKLDGSQIVKDHGAVSRMKSAVRENIVPSQRELDCKLPCILITSRRSVNRSELAFSCRTRKR